MIKQVNTYEGRLVNVHEGWVVTLVKPAWLCTVCKLYLLTKQESETHAHKGGSEERIGSKADSD